MKKFIYTISVFLVSQLAMAQNTIPCSTAEVNQALLKNNPELEKKQNEFNEGFINYLKTVDLNQFKASNQNTFGKTAQSKYIIPIVFHVLHNNGAYGEHYTDQDIIQEVKNMNAAYSANSPFRDRIRTIFKEVEGNANIEFRLAKKDPNGNPTTGVEHIYVGTLTAKGNDNVKKSSWDPQRYLNIWTCATIRDGGTFAAGGYAYYPNQVPSASVDGPIVSNRVGVLPANTSGSPFGLITCAHEVGHYLGLRHPFDGSSPSDSCGEDFCSDVPPVFYIPTTSGNISHNPCGIVPYVNSAPRSCNENPDLPDQYENWMDYYSGYCTSVMISLQQVARMQFSLENYRRNLWQPENLAATGVNDTVNAPLTIPIAAFSVAGNQNLTDLRTCINSPISFRDNSYNGTVTKWEWNFGDGATPATFLGQSPGNVVYSTSGYKTVTLKVTGANGTNTKTGLNYIYIEGSNDVQQGAANTADWDYANNYLQSGWFFENETPAGKWIRTTSAAYDGIASMELPSYNTKVSFNYSLISPAFNFSGAPSAYFQFYYAFASNYVNSTSFPTTQDALSVSISTDCGKTWQGPKVRVGGSAYETNLVPQGQGSDVATNPLSTIVGNATVSSSLNFIPSTTQWKKMLVPASQIPTSGSVKFKITFSNGGGNNFFIDNVMLGVATGINELTANDFKISVHPNPFNSITSLTYNLPSKVKVDVRIFDIVGKEVGQVFSGVQEIGRQELIIDRAKLNLNSGLYFVKMIVGENKEFTHKVVIN